MGKPRQQAYGGDLLHLVHDGCVAVDQIAIGDPAMSNCRDDDSITSSTSASSLGGTSHLTPPSADAEFAPLYKTLPA